MQSNRQTDGSSGGDFVLMVRWLYVITCTCSQTHIIIDIYKHTNFEFILKTMGCSYINVINVKFLENFELFWMSTLVSPFAPWVDSFLYWSSPLVKLGILFYLYWQSLPWVSRHTSKITVKFLENFELFSVSTDLRQWSLPPLGLGVGFKIWGGLGVPTHCSHDGTPCRGTGCLTSPWWLVEGRALGSVFRGEGMFYLYLQSLPWVSRHTSKITYLCCKEL